MTNISPDRLLEMCHNLELQVKELQVENENLYKNNERILQDNQTLTVTVDRLEKYIKELEIYRRVQARVIREMIQAMKENDEE